MLLRWILYLLNFSDSSSGFKSSTIALLRPSLKLFLIAITSGFLLGMIKNTGERVAIRSCHFDRCVFLLHFIVVIFLSNPWNNS